MSFPVQTLIVSQSSTHKWSEYPSPVDVMLGLSCQLSWEMLSLGRFGRCPLPSPLASLDQFHKAFWIYLVEWDPDIHIWIKFSQQLPLKEQSISLLSFHWLWYELSSIGWRWTAWLLNLPSPRNTNMVSTIWTAGSRIQSLILPKFTVNSLTKRETSFLLLANTLIYTV